MSSWIAPTAIAFMAFGFFEAATVAWFQGIDALPRFGVPVIILGLLIIPFLFYAWLGPIFRKEVGFYIGSTSCGRFGHGKGSIADIEYDDIVGAEPTAEWYQKMLFLSSDILCIRSKKNGAEQNLLICASYYRGATAHEWAKQIKERMQ